MTLCPSCGRPRTESAPGARACPDCEAAQAAAAEPLPRPGLPGAPAAPEEPAGEYAGIPLFDKRYRLVAAVRARVATAYQPLAPVYRAQGRLDESIGACGAPAREVPALAAWAKAAIEEVREKK